VEALGLGEARYRAGVRVAFGHPNDGLELRPDPGCLAFGRERRETVCVESDPRPEEPLLAAEQDDADVDELAALHPRTARSTVYAKGLRDSGTFRLLHKRARRRQPALEYSRYAARWAAGVARSGLFGSGGSQSSGTSAIIAVRRSGVSFGASRSSAATIELAYGSSTFLLISTIGLRAWPAGSRQL